MSTKTSIKRIALVAAAALTLGGFTAVSASAAASNTFKVAAFNSGAASTALTGNAVVGDYVPVELAFVTESNPVLTITSSGAGVIAVPNIAPVGSAAVSTTSVTATSATIFSSHLISDVPGSYTTDLDSVVEDIYGEFPH